VADILPSDELVEEPSDYGSLRPGTRLGRYELLVPIARGGMARVWAARLHGQRGFQKLVAIKTILPHLARETEFERMFLDEARIASRVHHPNVCEIIELGEEQQTLYLAMEWVTGDSFSRVLRPRGRNEALDPRVVARIIADALAGLHAAHELTDEDGRAMNVVHRDLSPHNVLLTADGIAKVCDFGVAKALGQLHEQTSAGQLKGKVAYMAPEQISGSPVDRRSDLFTLGVVLYEATTGQRPFRGDGEPQVMHAVLKGDFLPPSVIVKGYPQELERIITRALSPQAILRFPTAERMKVALEEFLAQRNVSGQLVTQSNVAHVVRARVGEHLERRRERIKAATNAAESNLTGASEPPGGAFTPSSQGVHRSGVREGQQSQGNQQAARALYTTLQMERGPGGTMPPPPAQMPAKTPPMGVVPPNVPLTQTLALPMAPPQIPYPQTSQPPMQPSMAPISAPPVPDATRVQAAYSHAPPSHGPAPVPAPAPARESGGGGYAIAAILGVVVAVGIFVGGILFWVRSREPAPLIVQAPAATVSAAPSSAPASAAIEFDLTPKDAVITVDGIELAPGARTVPRPEVGKTVLVVAHAGGFEDTTLIVDYFTSSPMRIALKPAGAPAAIELGEAAEAGAEPAASAPPKPKPRPRVDPGLPANPY
jgi:serine/threonine-protein kinase